jgi:hypothetical protein
MPDKKITQKQINYIEVLCKKIWGNSAIGDECAFADLPRLTRGQRVSVTHNKFRNDLPSRFIGYLENLLATKAAWDAAVANGNVFNCDAIWQTHSRELELSWPEGMPTGEEEEVAQDEAPATPPPMAPELCSWLLLIG